MARLHIRPGVKPDEPEVPVVVLIVDPDGLPGERAVYELFSYCYEGDGVFYLVGTDGWAEHTLDGDRLVVDIAVYPGALGQVGVDAGAFPDHSALDPDAALVLHVEGVVDPELYARAAPATAVFAAGPDRLLDDVLASDHDWPMVLALGPSPADWTDE
ncbi:hypothetical protein QMK19_33495 [Streptomyces sp. H10-C2]|uniref:hypothetical protein n=1 Tax=unclassified Streptomyces TaxID=2593676 RepID=UPI0024B89988|nr:MULTISPECIES: hypothetical protein [unclassified Streptomyces]MDJ0346472.1 hypothetical protein [Streptomyces sp. PH10-H1]MDJ0374411.1 hypothetical protein [Streptomyces sp. H10-C2]